MIGAIILLATLAAVLILSWPLACYNTHFNMLNGDRGEGDAKPKYISYKNLLKRLNAYKEDLVTDSGFPGYIAWCPTGENLASMLLIGMEITPIEDWDKMCSEIRFNRRHKFYWHADILRVDEELRWLGPISLLRFKRYTKKFVKDLPDEASLAYMSEFPTAFEKAQTIFTVKHQDLVKEYNERHSKD